LGTNTNAPSKNSSISISLSNVKLPHLANKLSIAPAPLNSDYTFDPSGLEPYQPYDNPRSLETSLIGP